MFKHLGERIERLILGGINVDRFLPIQLDITNACNLKCTHCYHPHHQNEGAASLEDWMNILRQYKVLLYKMRYRPWVTLCGGEPLTSPQLMPLIQFIRSEFPNVRISLLTNGTLITQARLEALGARDDISFQVSLDGPDDKRHDSIRGLGNFDRALKGVRLLKANGFKFGVLSVLSSRTLPWMEDFFKLAKSEGIDSMNFIRFIPEGQGRKLVDSNADQPLIGLQLKEAYERLLRFMLKYQVRSKTQGPLFDLIIPGLGRSGKYWESIVVDYQGYVIASSRAKLRLGHAVRDGIEPIFLRHEIYKSLRKGQVDGCGQCSLYAVCGGDRNAAYAATGNFLGKDPGCWKSDAAEFKRRTV